MKVSESDKYLHNKPKANQWNLAAGRLPGRGAAAQPTTRLARHTGSVKIRTPTVPGEAKTR
eukprot:608549-Hanusia_phi.AAC.2